jgi:hypothetical protein
VVSEPAADRNWQRSPLGPHPFQGKWYKGIQVVKDFLGDGFVDGFEVNLEEVAVVL